MIPYDGERGRPMTAGSGDRAALERLLGVPEAAWLVERVRTRIVAAQGEPLRGVVQLRDPAPEQRAAVVRIVGRSRRATSTLRIDLAVVEEVLRRGPWPAGLADGVETLTGPVVDRRAERDHEAAAWILARDGLAPAVERFPGLAAWWDAWCAAGNLKRSARAEAGRTGCEPSPRTATEMVRGVAAVLDVLPASGEPLAVLARRVLGDAHGLDASRPLGRLATAVVGAAYTSKDERSGELSVRDTWAAAGVVLSNVASTVLCLGVSGVSGVEAKGSGHSLLSATATSLEAMRAARMPVLLTLDQVRSGGVRPVSGDGVVHVCENPTVVEVVAERWARAGSDRARPVLVCTWGQPSTAVLDLLGILTKEGAECRYHGDFDWPGLRIAGFLRTHVHWRPWRYEAADYIALVRSGTVSRRLNNRPAASPWDPRLAEAMAAGGLAIEEEAVSDLLAADALTA